MGRGDFWPPQLRNLGTDRDESQILETRPGGHPTCQIWLKIGLRVWARPIPSLSPHLGYPLSVFLYSCHAVLEVFQDDRRPPSWIWSNRKWRRWNRRPRKPHPRTKHEVNRMTRRWDNFMAVWSFPKMCELALRSVGRWSVVGRQYSYFLHWSHIHRVPEKNKPL